MSEGHEAQIPFRWARVLYEKVCVDITMPKAYKEGQREIIKAGSQSINLPRHQSHFYEFGVHLAHVKNDEGERIGERNQNADPTLGLESVCLAFQSRSQMLLRGNDNAKDEAILDPIELGILRQSKAAQDRWNAFKRGKSNTTSALTISRKRKAE